jgi:PAS domain S-box-containing protein
MRREPPAMPPALVDDVESLPLNESAVLLTLAMRAAHAGHWALDLRTQEAYWSPEYATLIGVGPETPPSWDNWVAAVHPADRETAAKAVRAAIDARREIDVEFRIVRSDGAVRWIAAKGQTSYAPDGEALGDALRIIGVSFDVTEQKRAADERARADVRLRETEEQARARADEVTALLDATPAAIWIARDPECRVITGSRAAYEVLRMPDDANLSASAPDGPAGFEVRHDGVVVPPYDMPVQRAARGEEIRNYEEDVVFPDGSRVQLYGNAIPLRDGSGALRGAIGAFVDVTPLKVAEAALREQQAALSEADRRKDEFLAILAHELRNPLAPIRNAVHATQRLDPGDPRLPQMHAVIARQTEQLTRIVDDLLDVARITQGRIVLRREIIDVATILAQAVETSRPMIDARQHALDVVLPGDALFVDGDPARLAQVVSNLLNNAARYTEPGGRIQLTAERQGAEALVRVRDDGIGIAPDLLPRIFDLFTQADGAGTHGGIGIGLTVVRRLVEMHGGQVEASSPPVGRGSEFVVRLPALAPVRTAPIARPKASRTGDARRRIVVVDDNVDAAESLALLLQYDGHEVQVAHDGHAALDVARGFHPDVVLLDIGLPGMNGYDVARRLRVDPEVPALTLVALTGFGQDEDRRRTTAAGFDHHLTKPVEYDALAELIGTTLRRP